ncbi:MAG: hypothetical protein ACYDDS_10680 [Candidatus Sulfotelmatobacter sp.]|jgi:hypothetical protein
MFPLRFVAIGAVLLLVSSPLRAEEGCGEAAELAQPRYELRSDSRHHIPIRIEGYLTFRDDPGANVRVYSVHASVKNISKKKISYWSVGIETTGSGRSELSLNHSHEYFFSGDVLAPSESEELESCPIRLVLRVPNGESPSERGESMAPTLTTSAQAKFVQFSDGSRWGDRDDEAEVHRLRQETLHRIESLQELYSEHGEKAFMDALEEPTDLSCFEQVKAVCRSENADSSCVRKAFQQMLMTAARERNLEAQ